MLIKEIRVNMHQPQRAKVKFLLNRLFFSHFSLLSLRYLQYLLAYHYQRSQRTDATVCLPGFCSLSRCVTRFLVWLSRFCMFSCFFWPNSITLIRLARNMLEFLNFACSLTLSSWQEWRSLASISPCYLMLTGSHHLYCSLIDSLSVMCKKFPALLSCYCLSSYSKKITRRAYSQHSRHVFSVVSFCDCRRNKEILSWLSITSSSERQAREHAKWRELDEKSRVATWFDPKSRAIGDRGIADREMLRPCKLINSRQQDNNKGRHENAYHHMAWISRGLSLLWYRKKSVFIVLVRTINEMTSCCKIETVLWI